jgi:hypothetical protein
MTTRPIRSAARRPGAPIALLLVLGLALAACGGGNGNGNGGGPSGYKLRTAIINETSGPIEVSLDGDAPGEPSTVESCRASLITYDQPDGDWVLTVNGLPALESVNLEANLIARNLVAEVNLNADNTITINNLAAGAFIQTPSQSGICN